MNVTAKKVLKITNESIFYKIRLKRLFKKEFNKNISVKLNDDEYTSKFISCIKSEYMSVSNEVQTDKLLYLEEYIKFLTLKKESLSSSNKVIPLFLIVFILIPFIKNTILLILPAIVISVFLIIRMLNYKDISFSIYFYKMCCSTLYSLIKKK